MNSLNSTKKSEQSKAKLEKTNNNTVYRFSRKSLDRLKDFDLCSIKRQHEENMKNWETQELDSFYKPFE